MTRSHAWFWLAVLILSASAAAGDKPRPGAPEARMAWIENAAVKLGCDLDFGGAITWFSLKNGPNVINNFDAGRQVQMSFYGGPVPFTVPGQEPAPHWKHLGWNPIQAGDDFRHGSRVISYEIDPAAGTLKLRCVPLQWPLNQVEGECEFAVEIALHGATANVHCRLENHRSDQAWYPARHQELPAVYVNGRYHRLATYSGEAPFTGAELSYLSGRPPGPAPWHLWTATERWAAFVGDDGWGLGVWNPATTCFTGGFDGKPGTGGTADPSTGYIAPLRNEILDASIIYGYEYDLILGSLNEIRAHVYRREAGRRLPSWQFSQSREGWYYAGLQDGGWPIQGALKFEKPGPGGHLLSPLTFWTAQAAPKLRLKARCQGGEGTVRLFWRRLGEDRADPKSTCTVTLTPDGAPQERLVDLASQPEYRGALIQLILVPPPGRFELDSVALEPAQPE